ncbi:MAG: TetR/AcrR family transcriptional regulator [Gammaproteobacteria bacterium]
MAKPKTRERILETSLALFNRDGEPNVTTVDIANELDISPGNLYYHFHGKDDLVGELFARFHAESLLILREPQARRLAVEEYGYYLVVVFEHIHAWRFLYRDIALILQRYEAIQRPFRRLIRMKQEAARTTCLQLREAGMLQADDARIELLARSIALTLTHWLDFEQLLDGNPRDERSVYGGVLQVAALIAPYLGEAQQGFMDAALALAAGASEPERTRK